MTFHKQHNYKNCGMSIMETLTFYWKSCPSLPLLPTLNAIIKVSWRKRRVGKTKTWLLPRLWKLFWNWWYHSHSVRSSLVAAIAAANQDQLKRLKRRRVSQLRKRTRRRRPRQIKRHRRARSVPPALQATVPTIRFSHRAQQALTALALRLQTLMRRRVSLLIKPVHRLLRGRQLIKTPWLSVFIG